MAPAGGYKEFGAGLLVELFAACLTGASLGIQASPFSGPSGGPPKTGQFFVAINPAATASGGFGNNIDVLLSTLQNEPGAHVPGDRRKAAAAWRPAQGRCGENGDRRHPRPRGPARDDQIAGARFKSTV